MTKEEVIDYIIERYKEHKNNGVTWSISLYDCCQGIDCDDCPFDECDCDEDIAMSLLDRLVKAEESQKAETNLEHFRGTVVFDKANGIVHIHLINGWGKSYSNDKGVIDWLLSPYEEPKPKFKLTQFEYDLIETFGNVSTIITDYYLLEKMHEKGYFKDIPNDAQIRDILDNCEVITE